MIVYEECFHTQILTANKTTGRKLDNIPTPVRGGRRVPGHRGGGHERPVGLHRLRQRGEPARVLPTQLFFKTQIYFQ